MSEMAIAYERRPISVADFHRMGEAGIFDPEERVELLDGEVVLVPPMGPRHAGAIARITRLLTSRLNDRALVRVQLPAIVDDYSEPLPDFVVTPLDETYYSDRHPVAADVLLLIEVSESSLTYDRGKKLTAYARERIQEYWVVDLVDRRLSVFRDPSSGSYGAPAILAPVDEVVPLAFPDEHFAVKDIVG